MILLSGVGLVVGLVVAALSSRRAVAAALAASSSSNISPGLIGLTVVAVGTDLPEIASSIVAALNGHGDLLVGDAAGSSLTQVTLVLALLCLAGRPITADRSLVLAAGTLTTAGLFIAALMVRNGVIARWEGALLALAWAGSLVIVQRRNTPAPAGGAMASKGQVIGQPGRHALVALGWLIIVALAATLVVESFIHITDRIGVPELIAGAIVLSLGTSLPELVVDLTAIRRGAVALAIGDLFGSSMLDATLALGIGPALRAVDVSDAAVFTCIIAGLAVIAATAITASKPVHSGSSAPLLLLVYTAAIVAIVIADT